MVVKIMYGELWFEEKIFQTYAFANFCVENITSSITCSILSSIIKMCALKRIAPLICLLVNIELDFKNRLSWLNVRDRQVNDYPD